MMNFYRALSGLYLPTPVGDPSVNVTKDIEFYNGPNWNGRTNVKRLANGTFMLCYAESTSHPNNTGSKIHCRFSYDGNTWTNEDTYLDGAAVTNAPFIPTPSVSNSGAGESWLYVAPNGTVIVHTWNCYYDVYNGGTHQWSSTDHGKTFTYDGPVTFIGQTNQNQIFATDDDFVYNGIIYAGARKYLALSQNDGIKSMLIMNANNGDVDSWEWVSDVTSYATPTNEIGLTYTGGKRMIAIGRGWPVGTTYFCESLNMGETWSVTDVTSGPLGASGRHRIKPDAYLKGRADWWNDPVLIVTGFMNIVPNQSTPRRSSLWISKDKGATFSNVIYPEVQSEDGGYNDLMWNGDYKYFTYFGESLTNGWIKQLDFDLTFE